MEKSGDVVERVGHKLYACGKSAISGAGRVRGVKRFAAFQGNGFDELGGFGMADDGQIQSGGGRLAGMVVGRGPMPPVTKVGRPSEKLRRSCLTNNSRFVGQVLHLIELQPARFQQGLKKAKCLSWRLPCRISSPMIIMVKSVHDEVSLLWPPNIQTAQLLTMYSIYR